MSPAVSPERETDQHSPLHQPVNIFNAALDWLQELAPQHQKAIRARAMKAAGSQAEQPSLDTLRLAIDPPAPRWRITAPAMPTERDARQRAAAMVATREWRTAQERLTSHAAQVDAALPVAVRELREAWRAGHERRLLNKGEYEQGQATATRWRPFLEALAAIAHEARARIPDLRLAAIAEADMREVAEGMAEAFDAKAWRARPIPGESEEERKARMATAIEGAQTEHRANMLREAEAWHAMLTAAPELVDPKHHMRALRKRAKKARADAAALFGTAGRPGELYSDSFQFSRWNERQARAAAWAARQVLVVETAKGPKIFPLAEIMATAAKGTPARTYAQHLGLDEAMREERVALFITLTLPPQWHPNPAKGRNRWTPDHMPSKANGALMGMWKKVRARLAKAKIDTPGLRVTEPHKDGTPHLHGQLYVMPGEVEKVDRILRDVNPEPVPGRRIATRLEVIDRARAAAPTYVLKYLMKSFNDTDRAEGLAGDGGGEDGDHLAQHERVRAWASERGIRRFAWIGLHGIQRVWQSLATRKAVPPRAPEQVHRAFAAVKAGRNKEALEEIGALRGKGKPRMRLEYEEYWNRYGQPARRPIGIRLEGVEGCMPLKERSSRILSRDDWEWQRTGKTWEEYCLANIAKAEKERAARAREGRNPGGNGQMVTLAVSYPRGRHDGGCDGEAGGRTGPPPPTQPTFTPKYRVGDIEILVME